MFHWVNKLKDRFKYDGESVYIKQVKPINRIKPFVQSNRTVSIYVNGVKVVECNAEYAKQIKKVM